jgi:superfamily I DNA/RNA helicase
LLADITTVSGEGLDKRNPSFELMKELFRLRKQYKLPKYLSSRTVLSKGLGFDCVIIDMREQLSAQGFYVAMTRAMKKIYIISSSGDFQFSS